MKAKMRISDIARDLGISVTTVSFILNGRAEEMHLSKKLEKKVLDYISEIGYVPNPHARSLRSGTTGLIGMIVENISNPFFASIARMMEEKAAQKGYSLLYCSTENDVQKTKDLIDFYRTRYVDGYIIAPPAGVEKELNDLVESGSSVILFDRTLQDVKANSVIVDNYQSSYTAIKHLIDNGYKNIAMVTLKSDYFHMSERKRGYIQAIMEARLPRLIKEVYFEEKTEQITQTICDFLKIHPAIDAVFFATNYISDSGLEAIQNLGLKIPQNMGVVGFDDNHHFKLLNPSITAVAQPLLQISEEVIGLMLTLLNKKTPKHTVKSIVLPGNLIIRESSVPARVGGNF